MASLEVDRDERLFWRQGSGSASAFDRAPGKAGVVESPDPKTDRKDNRRGSRISLQTSIIASLASAAAAFAASRICGTGTLISMAGTPVVVAPNPITPSTSNQTMNCLTADSM